MGKSNMEYEKTPVKNNVKAAAKAEAQAVLATQSTGSMVWFLVKKHKFFLVSTYAIWMTAIYAVPALPSIISSLLRSN